jgi:hypothetical protein
VISSLPFLIHRAITEDRVIGDGDRRGCFKGLPIA